MGIQNFSKLGFPILCPEPFANLAVFCPAFLQEPLRTLATLADFADSASLSRLLPFGQKQLFSLDLSSSSCSPTERCQRSGHVPTHLVHVRCWKLARAWFSGSNLNNSIFRLARSTLDPFYGTTSQIDENETYIVNDLFEVAKLDEPQSQVGQLLKLLSRFPADIRFEILKECGKSPLSSTIVVCTESLRLLQLLGLQDAQSLRDSRSTHLQLRSLTPVPGAETTTVLTAEWVSIFGHSYLSSLRETVVKDNKVPLDTVPIRPLQGVKFARQSGGIRGLQLLYSDGTESNWLGHPAGWFGVVRGEKISDLRLQSDDLRCIKIEVQNTCAPSMASNDWPWEPPKDLVMWKPDVTFSEDSQDNYLLRSTEKESRIPNYPGWRLATYNPLVYNGQYVSGITVYCSRHGFAGIVTHGKSHNLTGTRKGCPVHLPLRTGETVLSVWAHRPIFMEGKFDKQPALLMVTSLGRTCSFCPLTYLNHSFTIASEHDFHWTPLSNDLFNPVTGIFHDPLAVSAEGDMMTFGITKEEQKDTSEGGEGALEEVFFPSIPQVIMPDAIFRTTSKACFLSVAYLGDIGKIDVRKRGDRCLGLRIEHNDGLVDILGQWDPSEASEISEIYRESQGALQRLIFDFEVIPTVLTEPQFFDGRIQFCREVRLVVGDVPLTPPTPVEDLENVVFIVDDMSRSIAWWFSLESDCVWPWNGMYHEPTYGRSEARKMDFTGGPRPPTPDPEDF